MERNPLEKVLDEIAELMQYAYDNAHKPVSLENQQVLEEKLKQLEKQVDQLRNMSDTFVAETGISDYAYHAMLEDESAEKISVEDRSVLKRAEELKQEAKEAAKDPLKAAEDARSSGKLLGRKKKAQKELSPKSRKGKFRTQGGYKNWKPL